MPGKTLPSNNSNDAPPPVLTNVTLSSMFHFAAAVAESPPPMMPTLPAAVVSATASNNALVPLLKLSNSKTPAGPFQMTVAEALLEAVGDNQVIKAFNVPSHPSGMPSSCVTILIS